MAYTDFDHVTNTFKLVKGKAVLNRKLEEHPSEEGSFIVLREEKNFKGLKVNDYLSEIELKGIKAEHLFKHALERCEIPCLYIGQGPGKLENSIALKEKVKSKRPDFLVNLPDIGILFFDVKCRQKIGFHTTKDTYFHLFKNEIISLYKLHEQFLIPVWIAFVDVNQVSLENSDFMTFYLSPISSIKNYLDGIETSLNAEERKMLSCVRIPDKLLFEIQNVFTFKVGFSNLNDSIIQSFAANHKEHIRLIEKRILEFVKENKVLKSNVGSEMVREKVRFAFKKEIDFVLENLIDEKKIYYEAKRPLQIK